MNTYFRMLQNKPAKPQLSHDLLIYFSPPTLHFTPVFQTIKNPFELLYGQDPGGKCQVWYYEREFFLIFQGYIEGYIDFK